jgi:hypothetical protein
MYIIYADRQSKLVVFDAAFVGVAVIHVLKHTFPYLSKPQAFAKSDL